MQEIKMLDIDNIRIKPKRYQKLNVEIVQQLEASIQEVGLKNPITVTKDNYLVSGLHRLRAMKGLGFKQIPVIYTDINEYKNDIEQIDENIVRQKLVFIEIAEQQVRKVKLMIKEQEKLSSAEGKEVEAYLNDPGTVNPILDRLKISYNLFEEYKTVILGLENSILQFMKNLEFEKKIPITKSTYLTLANLPHEWQFKFANELGKNNPNSEIKSIEIEYGQYKRQLELEKIRREAEVAARKAEEERAKKMEDERKRIEAERKIREEEAERKRKEIMEKMKLAKAEAERKELIRRQEELEKQQRARREAETRHLEALKQKQEAERKRLEEEEGRRREAEIEKKRLDEYYRLHNTTPPAVRKEDGRELSIGEIVKHTGVQTSQQYRVLHVKDAYTLYTLLARVEHSDWIDSIEKHLYRVGEAVSNYDSALIICKEKADMIKVINEVERCVNIKLQKENLA